MGMLLLNGSTDFNPRTLFSNSEQGLWLDPSDFSTMWQDSGKTTPVTAAGDPVGYISDKSGRGNHAFQTTSASRPTLARIPSSGRRNVLTYTEQWDNAAWTKQNSSITANATTAPNGESTADKLIASAGTAVHYASQNVSVTSGVTYTFSVYAKKADIDFCSLTGFISGAAFTVQHFNLNTGQKGTLEVINTPADTFVSSSISSVGSGWYRVTFTVTAGSSGSMAFICYAQIADNQRNWNGDGTSGIFLWGAQLETGSTATNYQKVVATTDVTESGGVSDLWHLVFDGADDFLTAGDMCDIGSNSSMIVVGGSISGASGSLVAKSRAAVGAGRFGLFRDTSSTTALYSDLSAGRTASFSDTDSSRRIYSSYVDRTNGTLILRVNATQQAAATPWTPETTSHDTTNRLLIGAYNDASDTGQVLHLNGAIFQVIIRQSATPTGKLLEAERYTARKTGVSF